MRDFVLNLCEKDLIDRKLVKRDVEGFLSAFNYNTYGATNINDISNLIFTKDDMIPMKLAERKRANPPPADVNVDISTKDVKTEDMHNVRIRDILSEMEDRVFCGKGKMYSVFKRFDADGDGYVSYEDFDKFLSIIRVKASK